MQVVQKLDEQVWREFVDRHPQGNIFHTPEMYEVFARTEGQQPSLWATVDDDGQPLVLLTPVQITLMDGLLHRLTTRAVAYGSVLCVPGPEGEAALKMLLQAYHGDGALFTELRNLSDLSHLQPVLSEQDFTYEDHLNFLVDLDGSPEQVMQNIGKRTRKTIRRALRKDEVTIHDVTQPEGVAACYELLRSTYEMIQVPLADRSMFEATFDVLHPRGMVKFLLAEVGGVYVASSVELAYRDTIYGWYGGMDREYSSYSPNELLLWYIFKWGAENGYKVYDFGGAGKPDEDYGVRDFKAKFGGDLVCFGRNTRVHSPTLLKLSEKAYAIYRQLL